MLTGCYTPPKGTPECEAVYAAVEKKEGYNDWARVYAGKAFDACMALKK